MSAPTFVRVTDATTGRVVLVALEHVAVIDGQTVKLAVPDGAGGLVTIGAKDPSTAIVKQLDGVADITTLH